MGLPGSSTTSESGFGEVSVRSRKQAPLQPNGGAKSVQKTDERKTDFTRWRLRNDRGVQTWHYLQSDEEVQAWPMTTADKYFLGLETVRNHLLDARIKHTDEDYAEPAKTPSRADATAGR